MVVSLTWTNPGAGGALDLATNAVLTESWVDAVASNLLVLGGATGGTYTGTFTATGGVWASYLAAGTAISTTAGDLGANRGANQGFVFLGNVSHYLGFDGANYQLPTSGLVLGGNLNCATIFASNLNAVGSLTIGSTNTASGGEIRLANLNSVVWRNNANNGDLSIQMDSTDRFRLSVGATSVTSSSGSLVGDWLIVLNGNTYRVALKQ